MKKAARRRGSGHHLSTYEHGARLAGGLGALGYGGASAIHALRNKQGPLTAALTGGLGGLIGGVGGTLGYRLGVGGVGVPAYRIAKTVGHDIRHLGKQALRKLRRHKSTRRHKKRHRLPSGHGLKVTRF